MREEKDKTQSKYNVGKDKEKRTFENIVFDSALEMRYYVDVILPGYNSGEIIEYERQKKYILQKSFIRNGKKISPIEYKADFYVKYKNGDEKIIDIKGCPDAGAKLKRKLFWYVYPDIDYVWLGFSRLDGGWVTYEEIQAGRKTRRKLKEQQKGAKGNGNKEK